jgi:hypothetical protein
MALENIRGNYLRTINSVKIRVGRKESSPIGQSPVETKCKLKGIIYWDFIKFDNL